MARIWIDIETTGLVPSDGHILEVAVVATTADREYREIASQSWVVAHDPDRLGMAPEVFEMHTKNGLIDDLRSVFATPLAKVESDLCKFIAFFGDQPPGRAPVAGSSVHFDREWLELHMPRVMRMFSHRCYDASGLLQLARDCGHPIAKSAEPAHRALADIRASIQLARAVAALVTP